MASTKGPIRSTSISRRVVQPRPSESPRHPTKQAALLLVAVTVLIVVLAVASLAGQR